MLNNHMTGTMKASPGVFFMALREFLRNRANKEIAVHNAVTISVNF